MEWWVSTIPAIAVGLVALFVHFHQHEQQKKISSARLALKLLEAWYDRKDKAFINMMDALNKNESLEGHETNIKSFLNRMEDIAVFWCDGTLTTNHVREFFGPNVKHCTNADVQAVLNKLVKKNKNSYKKIRELIEESKSW